MQADNSVTLQVSVAVAGGPPDMSCREATQVYITQPALPGVVTPIYSLAAFASTLLPPAGAPPTTLSFAIPADMMLTTLVNGTRTLAGGAYAIAVGGHLPDDAKGAAYSNALTTTVVLPWSR